MDLMDEAPDLPEVEVDRGPFVMYEVNTHQAGLRKVVLALKLHEKTKQKILQLYPHPAILVAHAHSMGAKCGFTLAADILRYCGWVVPKDIYQDPAIPPQSLKKHQYEPGEIVPLSRYFMKARVGDTIERTIKGRRWTATVLPNGKLQAHDFDDEVMTPTMWARKCQGRDGRMPVMPRQFWKLVTVLVPAEGKPRATDTE